MLGVPGDSFSVRASGRAVGVRQGSGEWSSRVGACDESQPGGFSHRLGRVAGGERRGWQAWCGGELAGCVRGRAEYLSVQARIGRPLFGFRVPGEGSQGHLGSGVSS